jgi:ABC-type phosphate/phosphonate transport system ATPase subunit
MTKLKKTHKISKLPGVTKIMNVDTETVIYRDHDGKYKRTYATKIYILKNRKYVIWNDMICWLRHYKNNFIVWTTQSRENATI